MNIDQFTRLIEAELDEVKPGSMTPDTVFLEMNEWCSLYALILISFVSTEYDVSLSGDSLVDIRTVRDLYNYIQNQRKL